MNERDWNPWTALFEDAIKKRLDDPNINTITYDELLENLYKGKDNGGIRDLFADLTGMSGRGGSNQS